jgi:hypothetical protein
MSVFTGYVPKLKCRHGRYKGQCFAELCEHSNNFGLDDPRRYFGALSSSAESSRLMKESPERYAAMKERARQAGIIAF